MAEDGPTCERDAHPLHQPGPGPLTLRPRVAADAARIVALYNRQEPESAALTVARYRAEHNQTEARSGGQEWVALEQGRVVGFGAVSPAWWTGNAGSYALDLRVDQDHWRQGIGTGLYETLRARLSAREATRLLGWVRADLEHAYRFAARHGFRETGQVVDEYRLHLPAATIAAYEGLEEHLRRAGLRLASLATLGSDDETFLRALQQLWAEAGAEPSDPARLRDSFASWQRQVLQAPGLSPETHWVALDGERPVGMTFLKRLGARAAENDYTAVAATQRGRGIATALKLRAIAWAREQGMAWFYTSSEIGNTPMITINRRLGYQPGARRLEVARDLP